MRTSVATIARSKEIVPDCRLANRTRRDQEPVLTEEELRKICMKVKTENGKPRENRLLT